jgi:hypothetical protein
VARSTFSKFSSLARFRSSTPPMPGAHHHVRSAPSTASPLEHAAASIALPSMPLDRFTLDLDHFTRSTPLPPASKHAVNLDRFTQSAPPPPAPEHTVNLDRFARSTPSTSTASPMPSTVRFRHPRPRASLDSVLPLPAGNP